MNTIKSNIQIETNPAGHNKGSFGYVLTVNGGTWSNGGYNTEADAQSAAERHLYQIKANPGLSPA